MKSRVLRASIAVLLACAATCCVAQAPAGRTLRVLHTNDLHSRLLPDHLGRGGFAGLAAAMRHECRDVAACLVLDAGDLAQGSPVSSLFRGLPVFDVADRMEIDASTLGNHEFDYGWQRIADFREAAGFPMVTANVVDPDGQLLADAPWIVLEAGDLRVGVIGLLTEDLPELTLEHNYHPWRVLPVVETVRAHLPAVLERADLALVLGHLTDREEDALLEQVPGIAAVISGHQHNGLAVPKVVDGRMTVRVRSYGIELGRLDLELHATEPRVVDWRWEALPIPLDGLAPDPGVAERVAHWEDQVAEIVDRPIGESRRALALDEVRSLLEQALRESVEADLGYVNPGGVRDVLPQGTLLARHVWNVMPFDNRVVVGTFAGSELPRFLVEERGLDPRERYRLATLDFVAGSWKERGFADLAFEDTGSLVRDVIIDWIRARGALD